MQSGEGLQEGRRSGDGEREGMSPVLDQSPRFKLLCPASRVPLLSFFSHHCAPESRSNHCLLQRHGGKEIPTRSSELLVPGEPAETNGCPI